MLDDGNLARAGLANWQKFTALEQPVSGQSLLNFRRPTVVLRPCKS
jgi:hypothetical protein